MFDIPRMGWLSFLFFDVVVGFTKVVTIFIFHVTIKLWRRGFANAFVIGPFFSFLKAFAFFNVSSIKIGI